MKAFVTGSTGFIGSHLVRDLLAHGYQVTALVRTLDRARNLPPGLRLVAGDVTKRDSFRAGMQGTDAVFHVAAWYTVGVRPADRERMQRINVEGTHAVLETAGELGVRKIVYTSTLAVYGNTHGQTVDESYRPAEPGYVSEYERTKAVAHYEVAVPLQQRGLPVIIVCPGMVYGPGDTSQMAPVFRLYARRLLWMMLGPDNALTWTHVDDIAAGHRLAAEKGRPGATYNLAAQALTFQELFQACERATGIPAPRLWLPSGLAGFLARLLRNLSPASAELMANAAGVSYLASADKARRELGWQPRPVEVGMRETIDGLRNEK